MLCLFGESGDLEICRGPVWSFEQLPEAHRAMGENRANGKIVAFFDSGFADGLSAVPRTRP